MKRPHNDSKLELKAPKRQKIKGPPKPTPPKAKRKVRLDELGWKTVSVPDRLEDFEGFYGLEEIEDITIVKDPATGYLSFETTKTEAQVEHDIEEAQRHKEEEANQLEKIIFGNEQEANEDDAQKESDEDVWEGFEDITEAPEDDYPVEDANAAVDEPASQGLHEESLGDDGSCSGSKLSARINQLEDEDGKLDMSAWNDLELSEELLESLANLKFFTPTPIQASTIPNIMAGRDVIGKAATGSGKTLAFGLPIIESFLALYPTSKGDTTRNPLALIISPTRELAHQITAHLTELCAKGPFDAPNITSVTGGLSVQKQRRQLEKADIVVGTPGRLWEVISNGQGLIAKFKQIRFLVVDEADRLLSEGHYQELKEILKVLDRDDEVDETSEMEAIVEIQRQTLVFSATFQRGLQQRLAKKAKTGDDSSTRQESVEYLLKTLHFREEQPAFIDVNPSSQMASKLQEGLVECAGPEKDLYLYSLLMFFIKKRTLVFTNSISAVRRLTPLLQNLTLTALPLHSNMPQKARLRSMERFKERPGSILIATDVAARGLDIPQVELVIHYHLPRAADAYIHRSGRTARAEAPGTSILICAPEEVAGVRRLVAKVHAHTKQAPESKKRGHFIRTLDIDRRVVSRLKARVTISKKLADAIIAKEKKHGEANSMRQAAEDLGVDYDSEEFEKESKGKRGRGSARKQKEKVAREMTKAESQALRAELNSLLSQRINTGVSTRYLTSGGVDVEALMSGRGNVEFLGTVDGSGFENEL